MRRIEEGFAGVVNPFGGKRYLVSLRPEDVTCFVFWSKDFTPFIERLETLDRLGYRFYFNYTITAVPSIFENNVDKAAALRSFAEAQGLDLAQVCFMGDDINDVPALQLAGLPAAPADAHPSALAVARYIARRTGGNGAVRELLDHGIVVAAICGATLGLANAGIKARDGDDFLLR